MKSAQWMRLGPKICSHQLCFPIEQFHFKISYWGGNQSNIDVDLLPFVQDALIRLDNIEARSCGFHFVSHISIRHVGDGQDGAVGLIVCALWEKPHVSLWINLHYLLPIQVSSQYSCQIKS